MSIDGCTMEIGVVPPVSVVVAAAEGPTEFEFICVSIAPEP